MKNDFGSRVNFWYPPGSVLRTLVNQIGRRAATILACAFVSVTSFACCHSVIAQDANEPIALSGFSESQTYEVDDSTSLDLSNAFFLRLLHRANMASPQSLEKYRKLSGAPSLQSLIEDPRRHRFLVCEVEGEILGIQKRQPPNRTTPFYVLDGKNNAGRFELYVNSIPYSWEKHFSSPQPIRIDAFFLKTEGEPSSHCPVFVGNEPEWYPVMANPECQILPAHIVLVKHGLNASLLHNIRNRNTQPIATADTESFYQLLSVSQKTSRSEFNTEPVEFVELVKNARKHVGDWTRIRGNVRRCVEVKIESEEKIALLGVDHYYEIDMFYNIGSRQIVIGKTSRKNNEKENKTAPPLVYEDRFPVTICATELPDGWEADDLAKTQIEVDGIFFRFWKYSAEKTGNEARQIAPLVMATEISIIDLSERPLDLWLTVGGLVVFAGILGLFLYVRYSDAQTEQTKAKELPEQIEIPDNV